MIKERNDLKEWTKKVDVLVPDELKKKEISEKKNYKWKTIKIDKKGN